MAKPKTIHPSDPTEERVLSVLDDRISLDVGQVSSGALVAPREVQGVLRRLMDEDVVRVKTVRGRERYLLAPGIEVAEVA